MAAIRSFVKIQPITGKSGIAQNMDQVRKSINRMGSVTDGIAKSLYDTTELLKFETEYLSDYSKTEVTDSKREDKKKKTKWTKSMRDFRRTFRKKKRDRLEDEAEKGVEEGKEEGRKAVEKQKPKLTMFGKFLNGLAKVFKYMIIFAALTWLENPQNAQNAVKVFKVLFTLGKFAFQVTKFGVGLLLDGLTNVIGNFQEEGAIRRAFRGIIGVVQMMGGLAALRTAQYMIMPWKLMKDVNRLRMIFQMSNQQSAEQDANQKVRKSGYRDKKTGVIYSKEEYEAMKKSAAKADRKSPGAQKAFEDRFGKESRFSKFKGKASAARKRFGAGANKAFGKLGGKLNVGMSVVGGAGRIAAGLASGEKASSAIGAGVGQGVGGLVGGIAGTALLGPFLGPFAPIVGNAIGSFLGEWVGKELGPIMEPIFGPIGRAFKMMFKVVKSVFGPIFQKLAEPLGLIFQLIGELGKVLMGAAKILGDFIGFIFGGLMDAIKGTVQFVVNNAKRLMDPASVGKGVLDALTFNLFDFDGENKKAAGGPVGRAAGGPAQFGSHPDMIAATGGIYLKAIVGSFGAFGFVGNKVKSVLASDIQKIGSAFGVSVGTGAGTAGGVSNSVSFQATQTEKKKVEAAKNLTYKENIYNAIDKGLNKVLIDGIKIFNPAYAKEAEQQRQQRVSGGGQTPQSGNNASVGSFSGDANSGSVQKKGVSIAKNFQKELGITKQAAAAIAGNFAHESAGFIPGIREGGPFGQNSAPWPRGTVGKGYGWAQWTNAAPGDRYDKFIQSYGGDYSKIPTNEDNWRFAVQEMKGPEPLGSEFSNMTDVAAAAVWFRKYWERAGVHHDGPRIQYAQQFLKEMDAGGEVDKYGMPKDPGMMRRLKKSRKNMKKGLSKMAAGGQLDKLDFAKGAKSADTARGMCVAGVIYTAEANGALIGAPEVSGGVDPNNHPRGLMAWAIKKGYGSVPGTGGRARNIKGPFGEFGVTSMTESEWGDAVVDGKIPSGALIFNTRHGWDWNGGSSGNDAAIAQDGGAKLWSGHWQYNFQHKGKTVGAVYSDVKEIVALTHPQGNNQAHDGLTSPSMDGNQSGAGSGNSQTEPAKPAKPKTAAEMLAAFEKGLKTALTTLSTNISGGGASESDAQADALSVKPSTAATGDGVKIDSSVTPERINALGSIRDDAVKKLEAIRDKAQREEEGDIVPVYSEKVIIQKVTQTINTSGSTKAVYTKPSPLLTK
jgi:hypothetical protein